MDVISDEVRRLRDKVAEFIDQRIIPVEHELNYGGRAARPLLRSLEAEAKAAGLYALGHPKHLGGGGLGTRDYAFVNEVIGRSIPAVQVFGTVSLQTVLMLDTAVNEDQRRQWVAPATVGDIRIAFALTEPDVAGSDPTQIQTTARLDGDSWVINGRKWFISAADRAAVTIVVARTETDAPIHKSFSAILVPAGTPGFSVDADGHVLGLNSVLSGHYDISLNDVRVPAENLVGERGGGFTLSQKRLGWGRIFHCIRWLGLSQRAFDLMCERANSRMAFGGPLADKQLVQLAVFDSYAQISACRSMVLDAAAKLESGDEARVELSALKVLCARMVNDVVDRSMQLHGAEGLSDRLPLEMMFREARFGRVVDGPDDAHLQRSATRILREYKAGRGWDFSAR